MKYILTLAAAMMLLYGLYHIFRWLFWLFSDRWEDEIEDTQKDTRKFYTDTHEISYPIESYNPETGKIEWGYRRESRGREAEDYENDY